MFQSQESISNYHLSKATAEKQALELTQESAAHKNTNIYFREV